MASHPASAPALARAQIAWVAGVVLWGVLYGMLVALGGVCLTITAGFPKKSIVGGKRRFISHSRYLQAHVSLILLTNTFFLLFSLVVFLNPAFFTNPNLLKYYRFGWSNAIFIFNNALCDGLLSPLRKPSRRSSSSLLDNSVNIMCINILNRNGRYCAAQSTLYGA
ncbi:hypothetical protein D9756_009525 [Leucocoprinus leucothites]|uniref:Uncharacterized protein n=1 Tax=Leucocoprinus leucothites TaxID=201217 RepID=A0A8H5FUH8_9AGAR|nr:hypothetical protein D9756_009525 [Leucoagaricus leucothites]